MKLISREASATLGSIYHFFPGGKQELAVAAIHHSDQEFAVPLRRALDSEEDPAEAIIACTRILADHLRDSDWIGGCPVTATALETVGRDPAIQQAIAESFEHWRDLVSDKLRRAGVAEDDARELAYTVINTIEGAELASQVSRSTEPLRLAGTHLARLITSYR